MRASVIIGLVIVVLAVLELLSLRLDCKLLSIRFELNMTLTEPDEVATLTYVIQNRSFLPMPFVSLCFSFPEAVEIREDEAWIAAHRAKGTTIHALNFNVFLRPRRAYRGRLHFSLKKRGLHNLGRVYVEIGDFLGFRSTVRNFEIPQKIICTARALEEPPLLEPLGGFLGDISVRRFIMEDPSLILGYRDYTGTEALKSVSWLQTARTGQLMVKKHDVTVDADVAVLLDIAHCDDAAAERCLSLVRTVSDALEARQIPYSVMSNGDLFETKKGVGRKHSFEVQKRIGLSCFVHYRSFQELLSQWSRPSFEMRGCIVIAPRSTPELSAALAQLEVSSGMRVCFLKGEEVEAHA